MNNNEKYGIGSLCCYGEFDQVGEGTYGYVYKAKDLKTGEHVALKKMIFHKDSVGFPLNSIREIKFLKSLYHKNIVRLKDVVSSKGCECLEVNMKQVSLRQNNNNNKNNNENDESKGKDTKTKEKDLTNGLNSINSPLGNIYLVFEFLAHDLGGLIDAKYKFSIRAVKSISKQLLEVLDYLNEKKVIHRDIKSSNILLSNRFHVKLADFGLARSLIAHDGRENKMDMTNNVVTMWYKAPELLLGSVRYNYAIDIWSAGCVMAELELGRPIFPGKSESEQFELICKSIGYPVEEQWSGLNILPNYELLMGALNVATRQNVSSLRSLYGDRLSTGIISLLERILVCDPSRRFTPKIALGHKYFITHPFPPKNPEELDPIDVSLGGDQISYHEYKTKLLRKMDIEEKKQLYEKKAKELSSQIEILENKAANVESISTESSKELPKNVADKELNPYPLMTYPLWNEVIKKKTEEKLKSIRDNKTSLVMDPPVPTTNGPFRPNRNKVIPPLPPGKPPIQTIVPIIPSFSNVSIIPKSYHPSQQLPVTHPSAIFYPSTIPMLLPPLPPPPVPFTGINHALPPPPPCGPVLYNQAPDGMNVTSSFYPTSNKILPSKSESSTQNWYPSSHQNTSGFPTKSTSYQNSSSHSDYNRLNREDVKTRGGDDVNKKRKTFDKE